MVKLEDKYEYMCNLYPDETGLPVMIRVDDTGLAKVLLFQADATVKLNWDYLVPMSISDNPQILDTSIPLGISSSEVEQIKDFVRNHREDLEKLYRQEIGTTDFIKNSICI